MATGPSAMTTDNGTSRLVAIPASEFNYTELADIYNQARIDYIVPMPMDGLNLEEYVRFHDVSLAASRIAMTATQEIVGISMLGLRGDRGWITRLGVLPAYRSYGAAQFLISDHFTEARKQGLFTIQLELIKNNTPAHHLFLKNNFQETRELLVIRRPSGAVMPDISWKGAEFSSLDTDSVIGVLSRRIEDASWLDETSSLKNAGELRGFQVTMPSGLVGNLVYRATPLQITHVAFCAMSRHHRDLSLALLHHLHARYPGLDTKIENQPADDPIWDAFESVGYLEDFRRIEMIASLT